MLWCCCCFLFLQTDSATFFPPGRMTACLWTPLCTTPQHTISLPTHTQTTWEGTDALIALKGMQTLNTHSYALFEGLPIGSQLQCECVTRLLTGLFWNWSTFHPSISSSLPLFSPTSSFFSLFINNFSFCTVFHWSAIPFHHQTVNPVSPSFYFLSHHDHFLTVAQSI